MTPAAVVAPVVAEENKRFAARHPPLRGGGRRRATCAYGCTYPCLARGGVRISVRYRHRQLSERRDLASSARPVADEARILLLSPLQGALDGGGSGAAVQLPGVGAPVPAV